IHLVPVHFYSVSVLVNDGAAYHLPFSVAGAVGRIGFSAALAYNRCTGDIYWGCFVYYNINLSGNTAVAFVGGGKRYRIGARLCKGMRRLELIGYRSAGSKIPFVMDNV